LNTLKNEDNSFEVYSVKNNRREIAKLIVYNTSKGNLNFNQSLRKVQQKGFRETYHHNGVSVLRYGLWVKIFYFVHLTDLTIEYTKHILRTQKHRLTNRTFEQFLYSLFGMDPDEVLFMEWYGGKKENERPLVEELHNTEIQLNEDEDDSDPVMDMLELDSESEFSKPVSPYTKAKLQEDMRVYQKVKLCPICLWPIKLQDAVCSQCAAGQ